jgi:hypothetical protein
MEMLGNLDVVADPDSAFLTQPILLLPPESFVMARRPETL